MLQEDVLFNEYVARSRRTTSALELYVQTGKEEHRKEWLRNEEILAGKLQSVQPTVRKPADARMELSDQKILEIRKLWAKRPKCSPIWYVKSLKLQGITANTVLAIWREHFPATFKYWVMAYPLTKEQTKEVGRFVELSYLIPIYDRDHFRGWVDDNLGWEDEDDC